MVIGLDYCREMRRDELDGVDALLLAAFGSDAELNLVKKLRKANLIAGEMVLPAKGSVGGYYALSKMRAPKGWLCLGPVAIHPNYQGKRNGRRIMRLLSEWSRITETPVVVVGSPDFYEKCGFSREAAKNLTSPYPIENTMLVGVSGSPSETLIYPTEFAGV